MRRYVHRTASGAYGWHPGRAAPPGARVVCEIATPCPRCSTRGGVSVSGDGRASCAECGGRLPVVTRAKGA